MQRSDFISMNLILHQFKTDVRHFRWMLLTLWLSFAAGAVLLGLNLVSGEGVAVVNGVVTLWQVLLAVFLVAQLVQADPLVGSSAAWLTRPVRRAHLFWAKSAFMLVCVLVPRLAAQSVIWLLRDYTAHQMICAALESLLFSGVVVAVTAVLAAVTRDLPRFFLAVGIGIAGMFVWAVLLEMMKRAGMLHEVGGGSASLNLSQIVLGFAVLGIGATLGWIVQAWCGFRRAGITLLASGLLAVPFITMRSPLNFLSPRLTPSVPLTLSVWQTNLPAAGEASQQLFSELILNGVPTQHVAVVHELYSQIQFHSDRRTTFIPHFPYNINGGRLRPADSEQGENYFRLLRDFFPAQTLWFDNNNRGGIGTALYDEKMMKRYTNRPPVGKLSGNLELDLFAVKKVAELPVRPSRVAIQPGWSVSVQQVKFTGDTITVVLEEGTPSLMLDRDDVGVNSYLQGVASAYCTYVLYHPGSGEAYVVDQRYSVNSYRSILSGEWESQLQLRLRFPYPAWRERFAGVTAAEWLREARLVVFAPVYAGTAKLDFQKDDYVWPVNFNNTAQEKKFLADRDAIEQAALPPNPTAAQLDAYLDTLCRNAPENVDGNFRTLIKAKFAAVGTNGLPALIRRLPLDRTVENNYALPAIRKLATREHLPELLAALRRDPEVVSVFTQKHWEADVRETLIGELKSRARPLPAEALRIVAEAKDAQTYDDLRWHFLRLNTDQHLVIPALEQCPGFDTVALVREAWARSRIGLVGGAGLAVAAAKQGLPDALTVAVVTLENTDAKSRRPSDLAQLAALTGYAGPNGQMLAWLEENAGQFPFDDNQTLAWLGKNLGRFQFDEVQQRYALEAKH